jgi:hypothetical protein
VWAFILAIIWSAVIEHKEDGKVQAIEIWHRFPKFVLGYAITFFILLLICLPATRAIGPVDKEIGTIKEDISKAEKQLPTVTDPAAQAALTEKIKAGKDKIKGKEGENIMPEEPRLVDELKKMEYEPILPVEKKLIGWSIGLGVGLLAILVWVSYTFFPGQH